MTISIPSIALNLDNNFKVSARKQHELPENQRVLSQRIGHKQHPRARSISRPSLPGSSTMIVDSGASIPRAIADDQFLEHFHDDTTTANLKCDEILDHIGPSSTPDPTTLKRPHLQQRVLPSKEQRVLDLLVQQTQPIKYRRLAVSKYASQHS